MRILSKSLFSIIQCLLIYTFLRLKTVLKISQFFNFTKNVKFLNFPKLNIARYTVLESSQIWQYDFYVFENLSPVISIEIFVNFVFLAKIVQNVQKWQKMQKCKKMHFFVQNANVQKVTILYIFDTFQKSLLNTRFGKNYGNFQVRNCQKLSKNDKNWQKHKMTILCPKVRNFCWFFIFHK